LQRSCIPASAAAGTGNQCADRDQFTGNRSFHECDRAACCVGDGVLARRLVDAAHAYNIPTVLGAVVARKSESRCGAIAGVLGHRSASGHGTVEKHYGAVTAEIQAAVQRVNGKLSNL
jgi:hypothetical protein